MMKWVLFFLPCVVAFEMECLEVCVACVDLPPATCATLAASVGCECQPRAHRRRLQTNATDTFDVCETMGDMSKCALETLSRSTVVTTPGQCLYGGRRGFQVWPGSSTKFLIFLWSSDPRVSDIANAQCYLDAECRENVGKFSSFNIQTGQEGGVLDGDDPVFGEFTRILVGDCSGDQLLGNTTNTYVGGLVTAYHHGRQTMEALFEWISQNSPSVDHLVWVPTSSSSVGGILYAPRVKEILQPTIMTYINGDDNIVVDSECTNHYLISYTLNHINGCDLLLDADQRRKCENVEPFEWQAETWPTHLAALGPDVLIMDVHTKESSWTRRDMALYGLVSLELPFYDPVCENATLLRTKDDYYYLADKRITNIGDSLPNHIAYVIDADTLGAVTFETGYAAIEGAPIISGTTPFAANENYTAAYYFDGGFPEIREGPILKTANAAGPDGLIPFEPSLLDWIHNGIVNGSACAYCYGEVLLDDFTGNHSTCNNADGKYNKCFQGPKGDFPFLS